MPVISTELFNSTAFFGFEEMSDKELPSGNSLSPSFVSLSRSSLKLKEKPTLYAISTIFPPKVHVFLVEYDYACQYNE